MRKHSGKWISYLRVSTDKQGKSGLGIEAQRQAVLDYLNGGKWTLEAEFIETESGKRADRPELAKAIAACKKHKAKLVIARLDRLARNVAFTATLMERKVPFVARAAQRLISCVIGALAVSKQDGQGEQHQEEDQDAERIEDIDAQAQ